MEENKKTIDVTALGELLVDFTMNGQSEQGNPLFEACPGGAPCNVLAFLQKMEKKRWMNIQELSQKNIVWIITQQRKLIFYGTMLTKGVDYDPKKRISDIKRPAVYLQAA